MGLHILHLHLLRVRAAALELYRPLVTAGQRFGANPKEMLPYLVLVGLDVDLPYLCEPIDQL
jgi:hypothetical protein